MSRRSFSARDVLDAAGISPTSLREVAPLVNADKVGIKEAPRWMSAMLPPGVTAVTWPWGIYVRRAALGKEPSSLGPLIAHEIVHLHQWRDLGLIRFLRRYLGEYLRARLDGHGHDDAYWAISLECDARAATETLCRPSGE